MRKSRAELNRSRQCEWKEFPCDMWNFFHVPPKKIAEARLLGKICAIVKWGHFFFSGVEWYERPPQTQLN